MKSLCIVILALAIQSRADNGFKCPKPEGTFRNPDDCESLYVCEKNQPELKRCSKGLGYNRVTENCAWVDQIQCLKGPISENDFYEAAYSPVDESSLYTGNDPRLRCPDSNCHCKIPDPNDCNGYYICINGSPYKQNCPGGLRFNKNTLLCDLPENVHCVDPTTKPPPPSTTTTPRPVTQPSTTTTSRPVTGPYCYALDWKRPHPTDCTKFYHCDGVIDHLKDCPSKLHFDIRKQRCEYPCIAKCDPTIPPCPTTPTTTPGPTRPPPIYCWALDWKRPHPLDCTKFYHCDGVIDHLKDCPSGLHFDIRLQRCEYPCKAQCDPRVPPCPTQPSTTQGTTKPPGISCTALDWKRPHPLDCTKFYHCDGVIDHLKDCPSGLHFDIRLQRCEYPCKAQCDPRVPPCPTQPSTTQGTTKPPGISCTALDWKRPHPLDCTKFYHCDGVTDHLKDCPSGLHFDIRKQRCEYPCKAQCDPRVPPCPTQPSTTQGTTKPPGISCTALDWKRPHPLDCTKFYHCDGVTDHLKDCPSGLHFDIRKQRCEYPCKAQCDPRVPPCPTTTPAPPICPDPRCPESNGFFKDPLDCNKYTQCIDCKPYEHSCPPGLIFNEITKCCDLPSNCNCGNTTTSPPITTTPEPPIDELIGNCSCGCCTVPDTCDCSKFLLCKDGKLFHKRCSPPLVYNPSTENCDFAQNVQVNTICKRKDNRNYENKYDSQKQDEPICLKESGIYQNKGDCSKFYQCVHGKPLEKICPGSLHFNAVEGRCDWPCDAKCDKSLRCN